MKWSMITFSCNPVVRAGHVHEKNLNSRFHPTHKTRGYINTPPIYLNHKGRDSKNKTMFGATCPRKEDRIITLLLTPHSNAVRQEGKFCFMVHFPKMPLKSKN